jgi:3-isopropylmalate/(R)-2-methylmalate dehydratase small subunit
MEPFTVHRGKIAVLNWTDVNTDLIIPARYLKRIERTGYGKLLFADKRYVAGGAPPIDDPDAHGADAPEFPLNAPSLKNATILVVGKNFGCGSSREHAVWAIAQGGYRAVVAPGKGEGFADIFEGNSYQNGLLPIELAEADWAKLAEAPGAEATIDLAAGTVTLEKADGSTVTVSFETPAALKNRLLKGLDSIGETLQHDAEITTYEQNAPAWLTPAAS